MPETPYPMRSGFGPPPTPGGRDSGEPNVSARLPPALLRIFLINCPVFLYG